MKRNILLIIASVVLGTIIYSAQSVAVCPEDTLDSGECDTLYVEILPGDAAFVPPTPHYARFPIYVTHDVPDPSLDSIAAFVIPLCYTSSNQNANAVIDPAWNNTDLYPFPTTDRSIFRHLDYDSHHLTNWMMALSEQLIGLEWYTRILDISEGDNFWLALFPSGSQCQMFPEGSKILLATITFTMYDTTMICIDSCFWPPSEHLVFSRWDAWTYIPRHNMPVCERICMYGSPPNFLYCPSDVLCYQNGNYSSEDFRVADYDGLVVGVNASFVGSGVDNVTVYFSNPPPSPHVLGWVDYRVTDHCQAGGHVQLSAQDDHGNINDWDCGFDITLSNHPPTFNLAEDWMALVGYTMLLMVSAGDADGDSVGTIELDGLWYQPDSLQPPTNSPSFNGGNPGIFTWVPEEADMGIWICSFSAADACGDVGTHQMSILVGMPFCGDCTGEGEISVSDVVCLCSYLFRNGPAPDPLCKGDANCNGEVDAADMVYLINYFFRYGPAPCFDCCP